jgi:uncharacterized Ntn-hydrolase superfamily protein
MIRHGTYSIVARDAVTGELGVAVQSHWFAVGPMVPWVRAGVGAVATQAIAHPAYGPRALDRLEAGEGARAVLESLAREDELAHFRQVAVVDARGEAAAHTGDDCIAHAGHQTGDQFSVQANMMASPAVWPAMVSAFQAATGPLSRRMLAALHGAEAAGGDARGRQSSALMVAAPGDEAWRHAVDVRVDDHPEPLAELERLLDLSDAYALASEADELVGRGRLEEAGERYRRASALVPDNHELLFWAGLATAHAGDLLGGVEQVREAIRLQPGWRDLLSRLAPDIAPAAPAVLAALEGTTIV